MKFVIATGGTGGHLFPALRVAEELKRQGHDILFLGSFRREQKQMHNSGFAFEDLGSKGFTTASFKEVFDSVAAMIIAIGKAIRSLGRSRPAAVIGFGGYGAFPTVLSAVFLGYPALIHEQNVVPGRANALLAKFVHKVAISFQKSSTYFNPKKIVLTGCPCHFPQKHLDRVALLEKFQLEEGKTTILVFGGSQGSQRINEAFMESSKALKERIDFQVIHISGAQGYRKLQDRYNQLGIPFALFEFLDKMEEAYYIADLVISRAGAATVSEIAHFRLPAILIPYPYAQGHQKENATLLCEIGAAELIEEKDVSTPKLIEATLKMLKTKIVREKFDQICFPNAASRLAQEALKLAQ